MKWCSEENNGFSHFGMDPKLLKLTLARYDIFHLRCGMVRKLLGGFMKYGKKFSGETVAVFKKYFSDMWNSFYAAGIDHKEVGFSRLQGKHCLLFTRAIPTFIEVVEDTVVVGSAVAHYLESLKLWIQLSRFINIVEVPDVDEYRKELQQFKVNVVNFYAHAKLSFLDQSDPGSNETFYCHVLRCYLAPIAEETLEHHGVGLGVFTMQGFEHVNKKSKRAYVSHTNGKHNVCAQALSAMFDDTDCRLDNIIADLKKAKALAKK